MGIYTFKLNKYLSLNLQLFVKQTANPQAAPFTAVPRHCPEQLPGRDVRDGQRKGTFCETIAFKDRHLISRRARLPGDFYPENLLVDVGNYSKMQRKYPRIRHGMKMRSSCRFIPGTDLHRNAPF